MSRQLGSVDFFALEAGDCLSRIESLISAFETPPAEDLLRAARALRGAAVLAQRDVIAEAATGYERLARALRAGRAWSPAARDQAQETIDQFRLVVRAASNWTDEDTARARGVVRALADLAGDEGAEAPAAARPTAGRNGDALAPGVRAFIAREGALVASALADAARRLRESPDDRTVLQPAARRLLALRGLGDISELSPLPEVLDAIELLSDDLPRLGAAPPSLATIADAAAAALARVCREVAGDGRPAPDAPDARHLLNLVLEAAAAERDVVPVETLLAAGERPAPAIDGIAVPLSALALVGLGEHLAQASDVLARTPRALTRDLRAYGAVVALRRSSRGGPPAPGIRALLAATRDAIAGGVLTTGPGRLAEALHEAGAALRSVADTSDRLVLQEALERLAERLRVDESGAIVPIESLLAEPARATVAAAPTTPSAPVSSASAPAPAPAAMPLDAAPATDGATPFAATAAQAPVRDLLLETFTEYERLRAEYLTTADVVPIETLAPSDDTDDPDRNAVAVATLLYRGRAALTRAASLRTELVAGFAASQPDPAVLRPLIDELLDLVVLALDDG